MISIEEAIQSILLKLPDRQIETVNLSESGGRVTARDVLALEDAPRFTNSAMDGFAVRFADLKELPTTLKIIGESRAGVPFRGEVNAGEAVYISTGAVLPAGADSVVPIEDCAVDEGFVKMSKIKKRGANVRAKGEEIKPGQLLLKTGSVLYPEQLALLASQGILQLDVFSRPKVALLSTGTEVKAFDRQIKEYEIRDSNRVMLSEAIKLSGSILQNAEHLPDDLKATINRLEEAVGKADVLIFTGGVSVGPHDHVKTAAEKVGFKQVFWKIAQQPGKPFFFAEKENKLLFGLPGNPVSSFMSFVHYVFPVLRYLQGHEFSHPVLQAVSMENVEISKKRPQLLRITLKKNGEQYAFRIIQQQGSHMISTISQAQGYLITKPQEIIHQNETRTVYLFPWRLDYGLC